MSACSALVNSEFESADADTGGSGETAGNGEGGSDAPGGTGGSDGPEGTGGSGESGGSGGEPGAAGGSAAMDGGAAGGAAGSGGAEAGSGTAGTAGTSGGGASEGSSGTGGTDDVDGGVAGGTGGSSGTELGEVYAYGFEDGIGSWYADNGLWEVGEPTSGPNGAYAGTSVAATVLNGDYTNNDTRMVSPSIQLPSIDAQQEIHLRFRHWFTIAGYDVARVQVCEETSPGEWSEWATLANYGGSGGNLWTYPLVDLSAYAGEKVRIGFLLDNGSYENVAAGWYLDDVTVEVAPIVSLGAGDTYSEDFEEGYGTWYVDNGLWELGIPDSGPSSAYAGENVAATVLNGDYVNNDTRMVSPSIQLPSIDTGQEIHLRFRHWFTIAGYDVARVQVCEETSPGEWSEWATLANYGGSGGNVWTYPLVDLSAYAGEKVRIGFFLDNGSYENVAAGWYLDNVTVEVASIVSLGAGDTYSEDFEEGYGTWYVDNGLWEVGVPTSGPNGAYAGTNVAATVLNGDYVNNDTRMVSPSIQLPSIDAGQEIHLRFRHSFTIAGYDVARVQVCEETSPGEWSEWATLANYGGSGGNVWTYPLVDLSGYAGEKVRIGFFLDNGSYENVAVGWYLDNVTVKVASIVSLSAGDTYSEDFEEGYGTWYVDNGLWEVGVPTSGPNGAYAGTSVAATVLNGDYVNNDTRMVSPSIQLPSIDAGQEIHLRFWHWFTIAGYDVARVQVCEETSPGEWSDWATLADYSGSGGEVWTYPLVDLSGYAGAKVRIGFFLDNGSYENVASGWYIDDVTVGT